MFHVKQSYGLDGWSSTVIRSAARRATADLSVSNPLTVTERNLELVPDSPGFSVATNHEG